MPTLTNPTIMVNGQAVSYVPNSFAHKNGYGSRNVRTETTGPGQVSQVITEDVESQKGYVKFTLNSTTENFDYYDQWLQNIDANAIEVSAPGLNKSYSRMAILEEVEKTGGQDATFDVIFEGSKAV